MIRRFAPADTDWLVDRHQTLYAAEAGFDETFGPLVRRVLDDFVTGHDPACEAGWIAADRDYRKGSIFCVRHDARMAQLRLFLLVPEARRQGLGRRLLARCMGFARDAGYGGMVLWTHENHRAACALYARTGWTLEQSVPVISFGRKLVEQTWSIRFAQ